MHVSHVAIIWQKLHDGLEKIEDNEKVKEKKGYGMGSKKMMIICYADDNIVITEKEYDLHKIFHHFHTTTWQSMKIVNEKIKTIEVVRGLIRCKLVAENKSNNKTKKTKARIYKTQSVRNDRNEVLRPITSITLND